MTNNEISRYGFVTSQMAFIPDLLVLSQRYSLTLNLCGLDLKVYETWDHRMGLKLSLWQLVIEHSMIILNHILHLFINLGIDLTACHA